MQLTLHSAQENSSQSIKCIDRKNCGREQLHKFSNNKNAHRLVSKSVSLTFHIPGERVVTLFRAVISIKKLR